MEGRPKAQRGKLNICVSPYHLVYQVRARVINNKQYAWGMKVYPADHIQEWLLAVENRKTVGIWKIWFV